MAGGAVAVGTTKVGVGSLNRFTVGGTVIYSIRKRK